MKNLNFLLVLLILAITLQSCGQESEEDSRILSSESPIFGNNVTVIEFNHTPHNDPNKDDAWLADKYLSQEQINKVRKFKFRTIGSMTAIEYKKIHPEDGAVDDHKFSSDPNQILLLVYSDIQLHNKDCE